MCDITRYRFKHRLHYCPVCGKIWEDVLDVYPETYELTCLECVRDMYLEG